ncbi:hypothetical protein [Tautonia sociabilis]|uniref:Cytosine permease n=1 Tax=Tautonia sociabilis TaxID=2080755 RepID=A0A432MLP9_9BACT|nr:hypothetical protein [Tautonia sociabilis]RUL88210.1 hypothetical protein TsocGM_08725 [Tautonia sociabilis]
MSPRDDLPSRLRKAMAHPTSERQVWSRSLAGVLIAGYLWAAYFDQLPSTTLAVGGLPAAIGGAGLGGLLSCALLFVPAGLQGLRCRRPMMVVATSAFGVRGSALVPGLLVGLVQILWFAVAVHFAVSFNLRGLSTAGLIAPDSLYPPGGGDGSVHRSTVYAISALLWGIASALVATRFIRWIAALMIVYPIFLGLALAGAMVWAIPGLPDYRFASSTLFAESALRPWPAFWAMTQLVFGFSATVAVHAINWGATLRGPRDVLLSGIVGVALASTVIASIAVLTVAGSLGRALAAEAAIEHNPNAIVPEEEPVDDLGPTPGLGRFDPPRLPTNPIAYQLHLVFERRIGGVAGGVGLILLGLGSLASAVYASFAYSNRLEAIRSRPRRWAWGVIGAVVAFPLMINGLAGNVPLVIDLTAGVLAPMLGVLSADLVWHRSSWPGPRPGFRTIGLASWGIGSAVGLLPILSRIVPGMDPCRWLPMALLGYLVALGSSLIAETAASSRTRSRGPASATESAGG